MQKATSSTVRLSQSFTHVVGDEQHWSWTGNLSSKSAEDVSYHAIIKIGPDEVIITLSDGTTSYATHLRRDQLLSLCKNPFIAHVDPTQRISRIQAALKSDEKDTIVIRNGEDLELSISVPWGSEFGDLSLKLDIARIPLYRSQGNRSFPYSAFERIARSRSECHKLRDQRKELELEVEELWEAKKRLDVIFRRRNERMQVFADTLNEYKRIMSTESTK